MSVQAGPGNPPRCSAPPGPPPGEAELHEGRTWPFLPETSPNNLHAKTRANEVRKKWINKTFKEQRKKGRNNESLICLLPLQVTLKAG